MKRILGLDASTATIGLCLLTYDDNNIKLDHVEYYKPPKKGNIFERMQAVQQYIIEKVQELKPDEVALEDILLFMGRGKKCPVCKQNMGRGSSAKTITLLAILNRTVGTAVLNELGKSPHLLNVMTIRHKIKLDKKLPPKEDIPELVATILDIKFPYQLNRNKKNAAENNDMADAIACALCYIYKEREDE